QFRRQTAPNSDRNELVNREYPTADPKSRLPSRGARRWNASHRAADAGSSLVSASNTKSSRASIAGPSLRFDPIPKNFVGTITISEFLRLEVVRSRLARFAFL